MMRGHCSSLPSSKFTLPCAEVNRLATLGSSERCGKTAKGNASRRVSVRNAVRLRACFRGRGVCRDPSSFITARPRRLLQGSNFSQQLQSCVKRLQIIEINIRCFEVCQRYRSRFEVEISFGHRIFIGSLQEIELGRFGQ